MCEHVKERNHRNLVITSTSLSKIINKIKSTLNCSLNSVYRFVFIFIFNKYLFFSFVLKHVFNRVYGYRNVIGNNFDAIRPKII